VLIYSFKSFAFANNFLTVSVVKKMKHNGYRFRTNKHTNGPEKISGPYRGTGRLYGVTHSLVVQPDTDDNDSDFSRIEMQPPIHLKAGVVSNMQREMQTIMHAHTKYEDRPHVKVDVYLHRDTTMENYKTAKVYNTHAFIGLGIIFLNTQTFTSLIHKYSFSDVAVVR